VRGLRLYAMLLLVWPLLASLGGCARKEGQSPPEPRTPAAPGDEGSPASTRGARSGSSTPQARTEGVLFRDVLASWESGRQDEAVKQLLSMRWDQPGVFTDVPMMNLSEKDFTALPANERERTAKEAIELSNTLRNLARHALSTGQQAQASGDKQTAKAHYEAVLHLGQALSTSERLLLIQLVGKALVKTAEERLSAAK
jgi:hypothetical protein